MKNIALLPFIVLLPFQPSAQGWAEPWMAPAAGLGAAAAGVAGSLSVSRYTNCPEADPNDPYADDDALQACLDQGGVLQLKPGSPGYLLRKGLRVTHSDTEITSSRLPDKVVFLADPDLNAPMLRGDARGNGLRISNAVFDGNKANRRLVQCIGYRDFGTNITLSGGIRDVKILGIETVRAMCGSGLELYGTDFEIGHSLVKDNGYSRAESTQPEPWADGITVGLCANGWVHDNVVEDSTDIGIVSGGGKGCRVERNAIRQTHTHAFAGLAVHGFPGAGEGDQEGSFYQDNVIESSGGTIDLGISVGIHPWFPEQWTTGGTVTGNRVRGASVNLAIDGFEDGVVKDNALSEPGGPGRLLLVECAVKTDYTAGDVRGTACIQGGYELATLHGRCAGAPRFETPCGGPKEAPPEPREPKTPGGGVEAQRVFGEAMALFPQRHMPSR